jgi:acetone carboxylase gamma subunit
VNDLPRDADNYDVFCERCQRVHKYYTFTQEDHDRIINEHVQLLARAIEEEILKNVYEQMRLSDPFYVWWCPQCGRLLESEEAMQVWQTVQPDQTLRYTHHGHQVVKIDFLEYEAHQSALPGIEPIT